MKQPEAFDDLVRQFERQEERVLQLVKIVAATNKRMSELTTSMEELKQEKAF